jgi:hypothetical protein
MRFIQHRFSQSFNGRHRVFGPLWQGRFRSRFVGDEEYLRQLIAYIHLNPVTAGVVKEAVRYRWCGHREVVGRAVGRRLVDVDETLLVFGERRRSALAAYRSAMSTVLEEEWREQGPGRLPWWRLGRPSKADGGEKIAVDVTRPRIGMDGLSTSSLRPQMSIEDFLKRGAEAVEVSLSDLMSRKRGASVVEGREILAWVGVELYGLTVRQIAEALDKHVETVSRLVSRAAWRRVEDPDFQVRIKRVDSFIAGASEAGDGL